MLHTQARDGFFRIRTWPPKIRNQNMATQGKKTAGYHLFRNVLPECNPILGSQLTAAATQLFSRDVRKRPAYVRCFSRSGRRPRRRKFPRTLARTRTVSLSANGWSPWRPLASRDRSPRGPCCGRSSSVRSTCRRSQEPPGLGTIGAGLRRRRASKHRQEEKEEKRWLTSNGDG